MRPLFLLYPEKLEPLLTRRARYKVAHGGRGSAKSWTVARAFVAEAAFQKHRYLCTREMQNSIRDSVHRLLCDTISQLHLSSLFTIQKDSIVSRTGSEFIFKGLRHNISEVKSTEGIDRVWCEEAEKISKESWEILIPTIRQEDSEIWVTFNPEDENSPTYQTFVVHPREDSIVCRVNYEDNPWFPEVLRKEMEYDKRVDYEKYEHVWMGKPKKYAAACIFKGKVIVEDFAIPLGTRFFYGADFGFSNDPAVLGRMFICNNRLYIDAEAYGVGVEIDELPAFYRSVPDSEKWEITADSERPDTISYLKAAGFNIVGAEKGKGSVEDGIEFLRSFEQIVIRPTCKGAIGDFTNYKWKTDKITGEVLPIPAEGSDHWPDAARYALEKHIRRKTTIFDIM